MHIYVDSCKKWREYDIYYELLLRDKAGPLMQVFYSSRCQTDRRTGCACCWAATCPRSEADTIELLRRDLRAWRNNSDRLSTASSLGMPTVHFASLSQAQGT